MASITACSSERIGRDNLAICAWRERGMEEERDGGKERWREGGMEGRRDGGMEGRRERGEREG